MERVVFVAYKPLRGHELEVKKLVTAHWQVLNGQGLVSDRRPVICQSADGSFVEVFGWKSKETIGKAHSNPVVQELWEEFARCCEYIPVGNVGECYGTEKVKLTDKEQEIFRILQEKEGKLVSREELLTAVWYDKGVITGRSLDTYISRLRKKLSGISSVQIINEHGKGYRLVEEK